MEASIEEKLIELNNSYANKQDINFDWEQSSGLRYVSDESLELAYELLKKANISIELVDNKVFISNNLAYVCNSNYTTKELLDKIKNSTDEVILKSAGKYKVGKSITVNRVCRNCKFQKCPKHLAGYIHYLISKNLLIEKLEDRKKFREENEINEYYSFKWNYGNILRMVSDEVYNFCYELAKNNLVYVDRYLVDNERFIKIYGAYACSDYKLIFENINERKNDNIPFEDWRVIRRNPDLPIQLCETYSCNVAGCPFAIAGIIYYLIMSGKEEILTQERQYYEKNKEQMDKELKTTIENHNKKIENNTIKYLENLKKYENKIDNFEELIFLLTNQNQKSLHCIVEGDDKEERKKVTDDIVNFLSNSKKISDPQSLRISLQNLAAGSTYVDNEAIYANEKDTNGTKYKGSSLIKHTKLKENTIYILTDLYEFIKDYRVFNRVKTDYIHGEVRKKQYKHIIDLLTEMSSSNYIIIEATSKEVEEFIELEPRLQYIYQNARFKIPEISLEEAFALYSQKLDNNLFVKLKEKKEEYQAAFKEYISLNKNFIPFNNRELASYLAMYSNSKGNIVFPDNIYKKETTDEALKNIIGLENVKQKVKEFEKYMMFKVKAEAQGLKLTNSNMHMIFTGNPGTGKTTIARIMAKMLYDMGIIKENKLVEVERKDLIAGYVGQTATKTSEVIANAMGGVLFIDEAYSLASDSKMDFGAEAIATIIKAMEDHKDELVVIFAGYKDEMKNFLDINPGISSRIGYTFDFEDYKVDELLSIFYKKIENMGFTCTEDCNLELKKLCSYFSQRKSFGNGRFVDKLIQEVILNHAINDENDIKVIKANDIPTIGKFNNSTNDEESTEELLKNIIGLEDLKIKIKEFENYIKFIKEAEKKGINIPNQNLHMIFTGNPGTGKTTIARIMAKVLFNVGIIHENKLVEVERKDLIAPYVGQTAQKTYEVIEKALGGVLFIDEAYSLAADSKQDYGAEAIATLIKAMEDHKGEFVVIFAGYKKEMGEFINMNSGIASRIGYIFDFQDYNREELAQILYKKFERCNLIVEEDAKSKILNIMNYFCNVENIGNGRFADRVFQEILLKHAMNKSQNIEIITQNDIPTINEITNSLFNGDRMINPEEISKEDLRETAIHEIGHALVRYKLYETPGIIKITINPEGSGTLGYVRHKITSGKYVNHKSELLNEIKVCLAGMAAEEEFLGEFANGNTSDLQRATNIARNMITKFGMSKIGIGQIREERGEMAIKVQEEINSILQECYESSKKIINENKQKMEVVVNFLLEQKEITEEQFLEIFNK